ncbi:MAG: ribonuclease D [Hyphomicrobiales bacterium]
MNIITTTGALKTACAGFARESFITVDTEFMRETTFWSELCLIQIAGENRTAIIDPLAEGIDLGPFFKLMADKSVIKVFHSAYQDVEIIHHLSGVIPAPLFDTQLGAMVCGFNEQVGYETIVRELTGERIDKTSRFSDWKRRPLSDRQLKYALCDVTHLRGVYEKLKALLDASGREAWLSEEMTKLTAPDTYRNEPSQAWRRIKFNGRDKRAFAVLIALAAWRENEARKRNVPRRRILKDEALCEIATHAPADAGALSRLRGLPRGFANGKYARPVLEAVAEGLRKTLENLPETTARRNPSRQNGGAIADVLKLALKIVCRREGVAAKVIASSSDVESLAVDDHADIPALKGWRYDIFGQMALELKKGRLAIGLDGKIPCIVARTKS